MLLIRLFSTFIIAGTNKKIMNKYLWFRYKLLHTITMYLVYCTVVCRVNGWTVKSAQGRLWMVSVVLTASYRPITHAHITPKADKSFTQPAATNHRVNCKSFQIHCSNRAVSWTPEHVNSARHVLTDALYSTVNFLQAEFRVTSVGITRITDPLLLYTSKIKGVTASSAGGGGLMYKIGRQISGVGRGSLC